MWQSVLSAQVAWQVPATHAWVPVHSLAEVHAPPTGGLAAHFPALQEHDEWQSDELEQDEPGQPKVQSSQGSFLSMMQPARSSGVSNNAKREFIGLVECGEVFLSALDSLRCLPFEG